MDGQDAISILQHDAELLAAFLRQIIDAYRDAPRRLIESIEYSVLDGGKRLRPALVLESWRACDGAEESQQAALAAAAAVELVHTFSLVHDDLPSMDDDDLRRGRATNHKVFGEAMAILAGDAMLTMAFDVLVRHAPATTAVALIRDLAAACGPEGMIGGQALDISCENQNLSLDQLQQIHRRKTAALLAASCRMGALAAGAHDSHVDALSRFGEHLGLAFQIIDDLLDVTATPQQLGKKTNKDAAKGKKTYPALIGLEQSRAEAQRHVDEAIDAIGSFGDRAAILTELVRFVVRRTT